MNSMQVIPAINAQTFDEARKHIEIASRFSSWVHIDVVDGKFSPALTWGNPSEFKTLIDSSPEFSKLNFEIHLMVLEPEHSAKVWLAAGAKRIIAHAEALKNFELFSNFCRENRGQAMISINPETSISMLRPFFKNCDAYQILAVKPGWAGQKFNSEIIDKISFLRSQLSDAIIEVDGGINPDTAKLCKRAGADSFVAASYIFSNLNPEKAYRELLNAVG